MKERSASCEQLRESLREVWTSEGILYQAGLRCENDIATELEASYPLCVKEDMNELATNRDKYNAHAQSLCSRIFLLE